jgi:hypothetical protein
MREKETAALMSLKVLFPHYPCGTEENNKNPLSE